MTTDTKAKAKKVRVITDVRVIADMQCPRHHYSHWSWEDYAKMLERECRDFIDHCKDHRSLDGIGLEVERVYEDQCSACDSELETVRDPELNEGRPSCANCGAELES